MNKNVFYPRGIAIDTKNWDKELVYTNTHIKKSTYTEEIYTYEYNETQ